MDVFECRGSPYDVGRQLATGYRRTRAELASAPQGDLCIAAFDINDAKRELLSFAPNLWEELHGIADGLQMSFEEAVARFSNARLPYPRRGCSAAISSRLYGRNYDFRPARYDRALVAVQAKGSHAHIGFADRYTGRLDGMNEHGLCVGLHYVSESMPRPGLACILIVRIVLDQCATTTEAVTLLGRLPHGLAFNYSLLDCTGDAAVVEASPEGVAIHRGTPLACTNHFRSLKADKDDTSVEASERRLPPLQAIAEASLGVMELFKALNEGQSPAFHHSYAGGFGTLHTMVCDPASRTVVIGIGANAAPQTFDLSRWQFGGTFAAHSLQGALGTGKGRRFLNRDLAGAEFHNVSLAEARFDDINFAQAEITANCNFKGMRIAGILVEDLFAAYRRSVQKS